MRRMSRFDEQLKRYSRSNKRYTDKKEPLLDARSITVGVIGYLIVSFIELIIDNVMMLIK